MIASEPEILCEAQGRGRAHHAQPAEGAERADASAWCARMRAGARRLGGGPAVTRIVVKGAGERGFLRRRRHPRASTISAGPASATEALDFWREEYELNALSSATRSPTSRLIDGIVMGGGVGVSLHGRYRVAGERYLFAMPEVGIGFFPDVGATYALPRLPGATGMYLALTGERVGRADAARARPRRRMPSRAGAMAGIEDGPRRRRDRSRRPSRPVAADPGPAPLAGAPRRHRRCFVAPRASRRSSARLDARPAAPSFASRHGPPPTIRDEIADEPRDRLRADAARRRASTSTRRCAPIPHRLAGSAAGTTSTRACAPSSSTRTARRAGSPPRSPRSTRPRSTRHFADLGPRRTRDRLMRQRSRRPPLRRPARDSVPTARGAAGSPSAMRWAHGAHLVHAPPGRSCGSSRASAPGR